MGTSTQTWDDHRAPEFSADRCHMHNPEIMVDIEWIPKDVIVCSCGLHAGRWQVAFRVSGNHLADADLGTGDPSYVAVIACELS